MLNEYSIKDFIEILGSKNPAPGGGSAAALCGAASAALLSMYANLTIGKKKYKIVEDRMKECLLGATPVMNKMIDCIDEDTEAFNHVMAAYRMDHGDSAGEERRKTAINVALHRAIEVPLSVAENCLSLLREISKVAGSGNSNAITDIGVAALLAETALVGAIYNVQINLKSVEDTKEKTVLSDTITNILKEGKKYRDSIVEMVENEIF